MDAYVIEIHKLKNKFSGLEIHHVIHDNNVEADVLLKLGSIEQMSHKESLSTSCITRPSRYQIKAPLLTVQRNLTTRS
jgi:hypothetical protein